MERDLGRRTLDETSPNESADSPGLGIVHDRDGGLWSPEVSSHKFSAGLTFTSVAEEARVSSSGGGGLLVGPRKVDVCLVNLDKAPGDGVNPGGVSRITGGFELDQSLDVASEGQKRERRVILDTQQPMNGAGFEQPMSGAQRERAADERQLNKDALDTVSERAQVNVAKSCLQPGVEVGRKEASGTCHMTTDGLEPVSDGAMSRGDSANPNDEVPNTSAAAEQFGAACDDIPTDQHAWTEEQFRSRVTQTLEGYGDLNEEQRVQMTELLLKHRHLWISKNLGAVDFVYDVEVPDHVNPIKMRDARRSVKDNEIIKAEVDKLLAGGYIEPANSPWSARLVLVPKPDGTTRVCVDYRQLNKVTLTDAYPTPRTDHVIEKLGGFKYFTSMDCEKGYYQVRLSDKAKPKTAFTCATGQYQWVRMPFGLKNAPAVFQRLMDFVLAGLSWQCCMVFLDDVVVFSKTWEDHLRDLIKSSRVLPMPE
jgi:hypothetical protein